MYPVGSFRCSFAVKIKMFFDAFFRFQGVLEFDVTAENLTFSVVTLHVIIGCQS